MICVTEQVVADKVIITVEGRLDRDALVTLKQVCDLHLNDQSIRQVVIQLQKLQGISLDAKRYLKEISKRVSLSNIPPFLEMELFNT
jgi:anti-anti-sigma regulatory factor